MIQVKDSDLLIMKLTASLAGCYDSLFGAGTTSLVPGPRAESGSESFKCAAPANLI